MRLVKNKNGLHCADNTPFTGVAFGVVIYNSAGEKSSNFSHFTFFTEESEVENSGSWLGWKVEKFELLEGVIQK